MQAPQKNNATAQVATVKPIQMRGRFFTAVALQLAGPADRTFYDALDAKLRQTPVFFENAPLVIDLENAQLASGQELIDLAQAVRGRRLSVFGIQNASESLRDAAAKAGLIFMPSGREVGLDRVERENTPTPRGAAAPKSEPEPPIPANKVITQPVRSGQTIFADRGDLVIIGSVSSGAEVIATGNVHIYGRLRGRALAGVNGDTSARIFCNALDAELLAIAGLYTTSENMAADTPRQFVQVFLEGEKLRVETLK